MMSILKNISFEAVIAYTAIIIPAIIWAFLKMKKKKQLNHLKVLIKEDHSCQISLMMKKT